MACLATLAFVTCSLFVSRRRGTGQRKALTALASTAFRVTDLVFQVLWPDLSLIVLPSPCEYDEAAEQVVDVYE